jgi:hypothetical protein
MISKVWLKPGVEIRMKLDAAIILISKINITLLNNKSKRITSKHKIESIRQMMEGGPDCQV